MKVESGSILQNAEILAIIWVILMMYRVAQTHFAGYMRPAGRSFESSGLKLLQGVLRI